MIDIKIPGTKVKKPYYPVTQGSSVKVAANNDILGALRKEARRRDNLVRDLWRACPYSTGDKVVPVDGAALRKYGDDITVLHISKSYAELGKNEEWPDDDCPLIVYAQSHKKNQYFFCTTNYLKKA